MAMLCPSALKSLLNQANTGGVDSTLLISREGSVMAHSGSTSERHAMITAAVASNTWGAYEKAGRAANLTMSPSKTPTRRGDAPNGDVKESSSLRHIIMDCEEGRAGIALVPGTDYVVSMFADPSCEIGLLKKKLVTLVEYLEEPLGMSNGLALLASYDDSEEEEEGNPPKKAKVALPNPIKNVKVGDEEQLDEDPSLHDYRVRSFPHVRGNWASFAYIDPSKVDFKPLQLDLIAFLKSEHIDAKEVVRPHLSVSRVVTLQHLWISSFTSDLKEKLNSRTKAFRVKFGPHLKVLVNEEATRTFISIEVIENNSLLEVVKCCDESLSEFNKEPFYNPPEFHISLLWCLKDQRSAINLSKLQSRANLFLESAEDITFQVSEVNCKIGNKLFAIHLK